MARPKLRSRTKKIAYVNQKGGVGKSTYALYVAEAAANLGARVLVRDLDPQGNVTLSLALEPGEYTMNDVLKPDEETGEVVPGSLGSAIRESGELWPKTLFGVPATLALASREGDSGPEVHVPRERRLQIVSEGALDPFDLVVTDCPPNVGQLTINGLADSDEAYVVTVPALWALQGTHEAYRTITRVQKYYNPGLQFGGLWVNQFFPTRVESKARLAELRANENYAGKVLDPQMNYMEGVGRATGAMSPLSTYGPEAAEAASAFETIAKRALDI